MTAKLFTLALLLFILNPLTSQVKRASIINRTEIEFRNVRYKCSYDSTFKNFILVHDNDTLKLQYYSPKDTALYNRLRNRIELKDCVIESIDYRYLSDVSENDSVIAYNFNFPLTITNSIIGELNFDPALTGSGFNVLQEKKKLTNINFSDVLIFTNCSFASDITFKFCNLKQLVMFNGCQMELPFFLDNTIFNGFTVINSKPVKIFSDNCRFTDNFHVLFCQIDSKTSYGFKMNYCQFEKDVWIAGIIKNDILKISVTNSYIDGNFELGNSFYVDYRDSLQQYKKTPDSVISSPDVSSNLFLLNRTLTLTDCCFERTTFRKNANFRFLNFYDKLSFDRALFEGNADFSYSKFEETLCLNKVSFRKFSNFEEIRFRKKVEKDNTKEPLVSSQPSYDDNFKNTEPASGLLLSKSFFDEDCRLKVSENFAQFGIDLEDWNRITLYTGHLDIFDSKKLLNRVLKYVNSFSGIHEELKNSVIKRIEYQIWKAKQNNKDTGIIKYFGYLVLEGTVNFGYKGGTRFFMIVLSIILLFAMIFYTSYRQPVLDYIKLDSKDKNIQIKFDNWFKYLTGILPFIWFSTTLFLSPKFSTDYLKFGKGLQFWIILEWAIGIALIVIYIVFIASDYKFVKSIIGI